MHMEMLSGNEAVARGVYEQAAMLPRRTRERPAREYWKTLAKNIRMKYTANGPATKRPPWRSPAARP